mmetsp:Transcript_29933/g.33408  ORF Transcript_29933/g.33408 Transcript_29933/m.33408 type:complete len:687 (+) Transcript_29933:120-2180(+)
MAELLDFVRAKVSKKKRRFVHHGYNLDLSYITARIIAMGYPAEGIESCYRNEMSQVIKFLEEYHKDKYKVFNLCSERNYDPRKFHNRVSLYPFDDHNPPPFNHLTKFCEDVQQWMDSDESNVVAIHCKAGKGRTGTAIACYLLWISKCDSAEKALQMFGEKRTYNGRGVTIPSQIRYVHYFQTFLHPRFNALERKVFVITQIRIFGVPEPSCKVHFSVFQRGRTTFFTRPLHYDREQETLYFKCNAVVSADVKISFYWASSKQRVFWFWFNTRFINGNDIYIPKQGIDGQKRGRATKFGQKLAISVSVKRVQKGGFKVEKKPIARQTTKPGSTLPIKLKRQRSHSLGSPRGIDPSTWAVGKTKERTITSFSGSSPQRHILSHTRKPINNGNHRSIVPSITIDNAPHEEEEMDHEPSPEMMNTISDSQKCCICSKGISLLDDDKVTTLNGLFCHWSCIKCSKCGFSLGAKDTECRFDDTGRPLTFCGSCDHEFCRSCIICHAVTHPKDLNSHRMCPACAEQASLEEEEDSDSDSCPVINGSRSPPRSSPRKIQQHSQGFRKKTPTDSTRTSRSAPRMIIGSSGRSPPRKKASDRFGGRSAPQPSGFREMGSRGQFREKPQGIPYTNPSPPVYRKRASAVTRTGKTQRVRSQTVTAINRWKAHELPSRAPAGRTVRMIASTRSHYQSE